MNRDVFIEWQRRQGHQVIETASSLWYRAGPRVFQAFPYEATISPSEKELKDLMVRNGIIATRYSTPLSAAEGIASYHVILRLPYSLDELPHQAKNNIKRGLRSCQVEPISLSRLASEGWGLQNDTLIRQGRTGSMSQAEWEQICHSAEGLPGFQAWGALVDGVLAASILTFRIGDIYYVPYAQCLFEYLKYHVNHALFFTASCEMLSDPGVKEIFFTLHSLDAPESINEFKFRLGFQPIAVRQRVVFHPLIAFLANPASYRMIMRLVNRFPENHILAKTEGMLRFHLQGRVPLSQQEWPRCVEKYKENTCLDLKNDYPYVKSSNC